VNKWSLYDELEGIPSGLEPIPEKVMEKIDEIVAGTYQNYIELDEAGRSENLPIEEFYGPVYSIFCQQNKKIYMLKTYWLGQRVSSEFQYHFFIYDPNTKEITNKSFVIQGRWIDSFEKGGIFCKPLIHFYDLNQDGADEVVIQEARHNGTMYNCSVYNYFHIDENMSLIRILALETRLVDLYSDEEGFIMRRIERLGHNKIKVNVGLQIPHGAPVEEIVGYVILASNSNSSPFQIVEKHVIVQKYERLLITASGLKDDVFIKNGLDKSSALEF